MNQKRKAALIANLSAALIVLIVVVFTSPLFGYGRGFADPDRETGTTASEPAVQSSAAVTATAAPRPTERPTPAPVVLPSPPPVPTATPRPTAPPAARAADTYAPQVAAPNYDDDEGEDWGEPEDSEEQEEDTGANEGLGSIGDGEDWTGNFPWINQDTGNTDTAQTPGDTGSTGNDGSTGNESGTGNGGSTGNDGGSGFDGFPSDSGTSVAQQPDYGSSLDDSEGEMMIIQW